MHKRSKEKLKQMKRGVKSKEEQKKGVKSELLTESNPRMSIDSRAQKGE